MASTTTYGQFPGVRVQTAGGAVTGVAVGREQYLVIVGVGDPQNADASVNDAVNPANTQSAADRQFGSGSELANAVKQAGANGANDDFLYGVMLDTTSVDNESKTSDSFTLDNAPIIEDESSAGAGNEGDGSLVITDTSAGVDLTVEYRYDSPPPSPGSQDVAYVNPITGQVEINSSNSSFDVDYDYPDWSSGFDAAEEVIGVGDTGVITALTESADIASDLDTRVNNLREDYKMATGLTAAEPNDSFSDDGDARYDTGNYTDTLDNDAYFLHAPARKTDSKELITAGIGGLMAGNDLDDSIYGEQLDTNNDGVDQSLSVAEKTDLRDAQVIPVEQPSGGGTVTVEDNLSTSTETDYPRDYFRRRIVDQVILIAKQVGDSIIGRINDQDTRDTVENQLEVEMRGLADDRLIQPNTDNETNWFVSVYKISSDEVGIDLGITPLGIVKRIDVSLTINT